ncbi:unnamed protein product [Rotaria sp. Silwood1]|nr:unnamed protein product [Rotaria sp. Silwood1]
MTRKSWDTMGSLLGTCISLKDAYLNEITYHAPCDKGSKAFPNVTPAEHDYDKGEFKDDCFKINAIPLRVNNDVSNFEAIYRYQAQLNYTDDEIFSLLSYHNILKENLKLFEPIDNISYDFTNIRILICPTFGPDNSTLIILQP